MARKGTASRGAARRKPAAAPRAIRPMVKIWLETEAGFFFCSGMCRILRGVEESGSIKEAARRLGKSYRFVWGRLKTAEAALGEPLVIAHVGGRDARRSELSPLGRELVAAFGALRDRLRDVAEEEFGARFPAAGRRPPRDLPRPSRLSLYRGNGKR